uniref:purine nucleoside phosphorylase n=1 Tax=Myxine glutinosa TaxID=7769 RepID=UPI00358EC605
MNHEGTNDTGLWLAMNNASRLWPWLRDNSKYRPSVGLVLGSGHSALADQVTKADIFSYADIPHFPSSTVPGHAGRLVLGELGGHTCVVMQGRFHMYEGYSANTVVFPVRVMKLLGVHTLLLTNAAGGLNPEYNVGDIMLMKDHIFLPGLAAHGPLVGPNDERFGPRFPSTSDAYDQELRAIARAVAKELKLGQRLREGVYVMEGGPAFESVAECRMLKLMGGDAVGMSTVPEVHAARHCGIRVFAISLITNMAVLEFDSPEHATHAEVLETGKRSAANIQQLIINLLTRMPPPAHND